MLLRLPGEEAGGTLCFVPADVARRLTELSAFTPVPGARPPVSGIALADGRVVTVMRIGSADTMGDPERVPQPPPVAGGLCRATYEPGEDWIVPGADRAVLCNLGGFEVALTGATVLATGVFDAAPGGEGVLWRSDVVPVIDVRALYAQAEAAALAPKRDGGLTPALGLPDG